MQFAPRIPTRIRSEIDRLATRALSSAEITRMVGATAEELGYRRPSYEQVRALVQDQRRPSDDESVAGFLVDFVYRPGLVYRNFGADTRLWRK
jgi:hypothetical protein